jgi:hypothetical protein
MARDRTQTPQQNPGDTGKVRLFSLDQLDQRTNAARRVRSLVQGIEEDLGGAAYLSVAQRQLAQRAALLSAVLEHQEAEWLTSGQIDLEDYTRGLNAMARVLSLLGLERRARPVESTTALDYARRHATEGAG